MCIRDRLLRHRAWHLGSRVRGKSLRPLDVAAVRRAASHLVGTHDFRAFRAADDEGKTTTRTVISFDVVEGHAGDPRLVALEVRGTAFMKNMVRILTGTLVEVGTGARGEDLSVLLSATAVRGDAGLTAPPDGLTLVEVTLGRPSEGPREG